MDVWLQILWQKRYIQKAQESLSIVWKKDETTHAINEEVLNGCIDTINEPITGLAVQGENIVVCTAGKSGSESNLYFLQKEQTKKNEKDKTDTGK